LIFVIYWLWWCFDYWYLYDVFIFVWFIYYWYLYDLLIFVWFLDYRYLFDVLIIDVCMIYCFLYNILIIDICMIDSLLLFVWFIDNWYLCHFRDQTHVDWTKAWNGTLRDLITYIKDDHTTGVSWNPQVTLLFMFEKRGHLWPKGIGRWI
jgi:hypothetical protein